MRIDSSGNVGIGTSSPLGTLDVSDSTLSTIRLTSGSYQLTAYQYATGFAYLLTNGQLEIGTSGANILALKTNNAERMRIDSNGRVAIGGTTVTDVNMLNIQGSSASSNIGIVFNDTNTPKVYGIQNGGSALKFFDYTASTERMRITSSGELVNTGSTLPSASVQGFGVQDQTIHTSATSTSTRNHHIFYNGNGAVGSIKTSGSSTSYNTSSDHRLKENVIDVTDGITRVKQLEPKRFNFIADADRTVDGFLAHEAQAVVPEAVTGTHNEVDDDGNAVMQGIDQSKLVPLLTAALKEAITKIETLETEMTSVKARLDALEGA